MILRPVALSCGREVVMRNRARFLAQRVYHMIFKARHAPRPRNLPLPRMSFLARREFASLFRQTDPKYLERIALPTPYALKRPRYASDPQ